MWTWLRTCPILTSKLEKINLGRYNQAVRALKEGQPYWPVRAYFYSIVADAFGMQVMPKTLPHPTTSAVASSSSAAAAAVPCPAGSGGAACSGDALPPVTYDVPKNMTMKQSDFVMESSSVTGYNQMHKAA